MRSGVVSRMRFFLSLILHLAPTSDQLSTNLPSREAVLIRHLSANRPHPLYYTTPHPLYYTTPHYTTLHYTTPHPLYYTRPQEAGPTQQKAVGLTLSCQSKRPTDKNKARASRRAARVQALYRNIQDRSLSPSQIKLQTKKKTF